MLPVLGKILPKGTTRENERRPAVKKRRPAVKKRRPAVKIGIIALGGRGAVADRVLVVGLG